MRLILSDASRLFSVSRRLWKDAFSFGRKGEGPDGGRFVALLAHDILDRVCILQDDHVSFRNSSMDRSNTLACDIPVSLHFARNASTVSFGSSACILL